MRERIKHKIKEKIDSRISLFRIFDKPRPNYVAKVTIFDKILNRLVLWIFPYSVKPNYITAFRFITVPFLIYFLIFGFYKTAFILFALSAFSDAVDGALARTRDQITTWGIVFDPLADKLLIGTIGGILIIKFLNPILAIVIISLELILILSVYYRFKGEMVPAKIPGKIKMILQSIGVCFIFLFVLTGIALFLNIATYILYLAVVFAVISLLVYKSI